MDINEVLFIYINQHLQNTVLDMIMPGITYLGGFIILILVVIALIVFAHMTKRQTLKRVAVIALIALLFSDLIAVALKNFVHEPMPFMSLSNVHLIVTENDPNSFPSGHATSTLAVVSVFLLNMYELAKKHHVIFDIALVVFAVIIMFSRVYCGVHYPFDVLAGALIGIFGALIVNHFSDKIFTILKLIRR